MTREEMLKAATAIVTADRESQYGKPEDSFECIRQLWNVYLSARCILQEPSMSSPGRELEKHDVAVMMAILKLARIVKSPEKEDSWIDLAGYAACGCEIATKKQPNG